jgi:hypothetical protein
MKLKRKYLVGFRSGQRSPQSGRSGVAKRRKLDANSKKKLAPQPKMVMRLRADGKCRMERVEA